jgi:hypothetical protein
VDSPPDRDKKGTAPSPEVQTTDEAPKRERIDSLRDLVNAYGSFPAGQLQGEIFAKIFAQEIDKLDSDGARRDFWELCANGGCHPYVLAAIVSLIRYRVGIETWWAAVVGSKTAREDFTNTLQLAASAIERAFRFPIDETAAAQLTSRGITVPSRLVSDLHFYIRVVNLAGLIADDMGVRSLEHVGELILASYVAKTTGTANHDRVAGLLSELDSSRDFAGQGAQKVWRSRNKEILDDPSSAISVLTDLLADLSKVLPRTGNAAASESDRPS